MTLYRVLRRLAHKDTYIQPGTVAILPFKASDLAILETRGAIAPVSTPPLAVLPGWSEKAKAAQKHGIVTVADLLDALHTNRAQVARWLRVSVDDAAAMQQSLIKEWLIAPPPKDG